MKILLVEDEIGIANFLKQGLEEELYHVDTANDGDLGLELAISKTYDLILLDWMLPGNTGLTICQEVRKTNKEVPILFNGKRYPTGNYCGTPSWSERLYQKTLPF